MDYSLEDSTYTINLQFKKRTPNPARIFRTMASTIDLFSNFDGIALDSLRVGGVPVPYIQDITSGSIKAKLHVLLQGIDDSALKKGNIKQIVGSFLLTVKYLLLDWLEGKESIKDKQEIKDLQQKIKEAAEKADPKRIASTEKVSLKDISLILVALSDVIKELRNNDRIKIESAHIDKSLPTKFLFTKEDMQRILADESIVTTEKGVLLVRKPDFLRESTWQFRYNNKFIDVKIHDHEWLTSFLGREVTVKPGDSLKAVVKSEIKQSDEGDIVSEIYTIEKVLEVMPKPPQTGSLFKDIINNQQ